MEQLLGVQKKVKNVPHQLVSTFTQLGISNVQVPSWALLRSSTKKKRNKIKDK